MSHDAHLWETGRPGAFRWLLATLYSMLTFLVVLQLANPQAVQRIAAEGIGRGLLAGLCALLVVSSLMGMAAALGVHLAAGADEQSVADAVLHLSLAATGSYLLFGPRFVSHAFAETTLCAAGVCTIALGLIAGGHALRDGVGPRNQRNGKGQLTTRGRLLRSLLFVALGAPLVASFGAPGVLEEAHRGLAVPGLLLAAATGLAGYAVHLVWYSQRRPTY